MARNFPPVSCVLCRFDILKVQIPQWEETLFDWNASRCTHLESGRWLHRAGWKINGSSNTVCNDGVLNTKGSEKSSTVPWIEDNLVNDTVSITFLVQVCIRVQR